MKPWVLLTHFNSDVSTDVSWLIWSFVPLDLAVLVSDAQGCVCSVSLWVSLASALWTQSDEAQPSLHQPAASSQCSREQENPPKHRVGRVTTTMQDTGTSTALLTPWIFSEPTYRFAFGCIRPQWWFYLIFVCSYLLTYFQGNSWNCIFFSKRVFGGRNLTEAGEHEDGHERERHFRCFWRCLIGALWRLRHPALLSDPTSLPPTRPRPLPNGMGQTLQEARGRAGEDLPAWKHDVTSSHQRLAERARPKQLLPQQRRTGESSTVGFNRPNHNTVYKVFNQIHRYVNGF